MGMNRCNLNSEGHAIQRGITDETPNQQHLCPLIAKIVIIYKLKYVELEVLTTIVSMSNNNSSLWSQMNVQSCLSNIVQGYNSRRTAMIHWLISSLYVIPCWHMLGIVFLGELC